MLDGTYLTIGELAKICNTPAWKIRRVVDSLAPGLPRAGLYRLVPKSMLGEIAIELQRQDRSAKREGSSRCE